MNPLSSPAAKFATVVPFDGQLKSAAHTLGRASYLLITNSGAAAATCAIRCVEPISGGIQYDASVIVPAGASLYFWGEADQVRATGTGADITAIAFFN